MVQYIIYSMFAYCFDKFMVLIYRDSMLQLQPILDSKENERHKLPSVSVAQVIHYYTSLRSSVSYDINSL